MEAALHHPFVMPNLSRAISMRSLPKEVIFPVRPQAAAPRARAHTYPKATADVQEGQKDPKAALPPKKRSGAIAAFLCLLVQKLSLKKERFA